MSSPRDEVNALLAEHGTLLRRARHGDIWRLPGGIVMVGQHVSEGDPRAWKNTLADVRRTLRRAGIETREKEQPVNGEPEAATAVPAHAQTIPEGLGIHVERRKRIIEVEVGEATADVAALARLLGMTVGPGSSVKLIGVDGNEVEGPVVILVETPHMPREERI